MVGKSLAHYQILEKLGAGGMGVVYKARDTHLDRFVAIKVLPPEKVSDPDRKRRFIQEARAASALNHPNIITIHDIDQADGIDFIAMEYVAGKTLDELILRKGMRLSLALKYAIQVASGLTRAHSAGIIHRDLKPSNVMVDDHGLVKVLDFGLAKLTEASGPEAETASARTGDGTILGTTAYMSPEQAEGKPVDTRSDIFSFGSMFYEMLTGQRPFQGDTRASIVASILREEPKPVTQVAEGLPRQAERIVKRCLRKDPEHRFQTMADLRVTLEELKEESDSGALEPATGPGVTSRGKLWWTGVLAGVTVIAAALAVAVWLWLGRSRPAAEEGTLVPVPLTSYPGTETYPSFSPDGTQVAYQGCPDGWAPGRNCDIYVKQIGLEPPSRLTNTPEQELCPTWSPNGMFIAYLRKLSTEKVALIRIPQRGGLERVIAELNMPIPSYLGLEGPSLAWAPDSKWIAVPEQESGGKVWSLYLISVETAEKRRLTHAPEEGGEGGDTNPAFLPDGRILAFARTPRAFFTELWLLRLGEGYGPQSEPQRVVSANPNNLGPTWTPDGSEIVFSSGDSLWRVAASDPAKPRRLPLASENASAPAISRLGNRLAYSVERTEMNIWRIDLQGPDRKPGAPYEFISSTRAEMPLAISPDGKRIAFYSERSGDRGIWLCDSDGSNPVQIDTVPTHGGGRKWSPDGQSIAYGKNVGGNFDIYVISANGGTPRRLTTDPAADNYPSWSPDGQSIYFKSLRSGTAQIWKVPASGGNAVHVTRIAAEGMDLTQVSPDGKYFFYSTGYPGPQSVWRLPIEGGEATKLIDGVHTEALWTVSRDGVYFFTKPDKKGHSDLAVYEFATGKIRKIVTIERPITFMIVASLDGRTILYTQIDQAGSDLMLVENFR